MTNRTLVVAVFAFLIGVALSPFFIPKAQAAGMNGWQSQEISRVIDLLERIAENTEK